MRMTGPAGWAPPGWDWENEINLKSHARVIPRRLRPTDRYAKSPTRERAGEMMIPVINMRPKIVFVTACKIGRGLT